MKPLIELAIGAKFKFPKPTMLTGVYVHTGKVFVDDTDYLYVHEVSTPVDMFISSKGTEVIPIED